MLEGEVAGFQSGPGSQKSYAKTSTETQYVAVAKNALRFTRRKCPHTVSMFRLQGGEGTYTYRDLSRSIT